MKINLQNYRQEFDHWIKAFDQFVDHASKPTLNDLKTTLEDGIDNKREAFKWIPRNVVSTIIADSYDRRKPSASDPVYIDWWFEAEFARCEDTRKKKIWLVNSMCTQFNVRNASDNASIMQFHVDLRDGKQLGPHVHLQMAEEYMKRNVGVPLAVPRFPLATVLPTDCMDLVLSEFFPHTWPQSQSGAHGVANLRDAQLRRLKTMASEIVKLWGKQTKQTPVSVVQDCLLPDIELA
ncbi:hypothetical protein [Neorhizobium sp. T25_13]|uniref:hypothetical protein n=1 Tax=Neorhizobium sp. T25_13 TaxID=2093830 RepID=UPI000CF9DECF|nr:hypothetical protein [Neorhizobium sp. T25_13]